MEINILFDLYGYLNAEIVNFYHMEKRIDLKI